MFTGKRYFLLPVTCILLFVGCSLLQKDKKSTENVAQEVEEKEPEEPKGERVLIHTEYGDMIVELYDKTPIHKENFLKLAGSGFYDSTLFHRVINGFMIQGGDPDSKGAPAGMRLGNGGPDYTLEAEFDTTLIHSKGALAAALVQAALGLADDGAEPAERHVQRERDADERDHDPGIDVVQVEREPADEQGQADGAEDGPVGLVRDVVMLAVAVRRFAHRRRPLVSRPVSTFVDLQVLLLITTMMAT